MSFLRYRYRRFHASQLLFWTCVGILVGVGLGHFSGNNDTMFYVIAFVLFVGAFHSKRWWALIIICVAGGMIGFARGANHQMALAKYDEMIGKKVTMVGTLSGDAQDTSKGTTKLVLGNMRIGGKSYTGEVFVTTAGRVSVKRGDTLTVSGKVRDGFATYPITMSYAQLQKTERGPDVIRDIREGFSNTVRHYVIEPMASLGLGFVVGQRSTLPDELDEQLKVVGLTHIVVASGYNLTILVRFMMRLLARRSRYLAFTGALVLTLAFVLFSGFSPSMNRAVIVTVLSLLAWYIGRRFHPMYLLVYVAAGTALLNPMYVWADLGWYLSFFAFAGVLIVSPLLIARFYRRREPTSFEQLVIETMAAEVMALPLIALAFSVVPVFGLVANVLVAPVIPFAMVLTAATGFMGLIVPIVGALCAMPTTIVIAYIVAVVEWLASYPWAQLSVDIPLVAVVMWYLIIALLCFRWWQVSGYDFRKIYRPHHFD